MKKILSLLSIVMIYANGAIAQVTIGSLDAPVEGAVLELKSETLGFLPTRVELSALNDPSPLPNHEEGMVVYNLTEDADESLQRGFYYNDGERWIRLSTSPVIAEKWFYMPSIAFDTTIKGPTSRNLYDEFVAQLCSTAGVISSTSAPPKVLSSIPAATDFYYYVTAYDPSVFDKIVIDDNGDMSYDIIGDATDETFINIVFIEK